MKEFKRVRRKEQQYAHLKDPMKKMRLTKEEKSLVRKKLQIKTKTKIMKATHLKIVLKETTRRKKRNIL
jgi:hypothetical protein